MAKEPRFQPTPPSQIAARSLTSSSAAPALASAPAATSEAKEPRSQTSSSPKHEFGKLSMIKDVAPVFQPKPDALAAEELAFQRSSQSALSSFPKAQKSVIVGLGEPFKGTFLGLKLRHAKYSTPTPKALSTPNPFACLYDDLLTRTIAGCGPALSNTTAKPVHSTSAKNTSAHFALPATRYPRKKTNLEAALAALPSVPDEVMFPELFPSKPKSKPSSALTDPTPPSPTATKPKVSSPSPMLGDSEKNNFTETKVVETMEGIEASTFDRVPAEPSGAAARHVGTNNHQRLKEKDMEGIV